MTAKLTPENADQAPKPKVLPRKAPSPLWQHVLIVLLAGGLCFLPGLNSYGVIDPSDGLYAEAAREMLERSDWITPSSNYKPFFEKPILIYWMIMASYNLLGVSEFAARLPIALCGVASCLALLVFTRRFFSPRASLLSALAFMSIPLYVVVGRVALTDVPLTFFMMLGALGLFSRLRGAAWPSLAVAYIGLGLALLMKGPVPVGMVGLLVIAYLLLTRPNGADGGYRWWWQQALRLHPLLGIVVMLSVALPWYIFEGIATHGKFFEEFFIRQNLGRAMGNVNHQNPFWFYIPVFLGGFFPWSIFVLADLKRLFAQLKQRWPKTQRASLEMFATIWLLLILVIFSVLKTKLATYILPVAPALAILSGSILDRLIRQRKSKLVAWSLLPIVAIVFPAIGYFARGICTEAGFDESSYHAYMLFGGFLWAFLLVSTFFAFRKKLDDSVTTFACATAFACGTLVPISLMAHYTHTDLPLKELLIRVVADKAQVALYMRDSPAVTFYLRRPVVEISTLLDYKKYVESGKKPHYLLVTTDVMKQMKEPPPMWKLLEKKSKWHLFAIDPL